GGMKELFERFPRQVADDMDARLVPHEAAPAVVAGDHQAQAGPASLRQPEGLDRQMPALLGEEVLGNEQQRAVRVVLGTAVGPYASVSRSDPRHPLWRDAVVVDQVLADVMAEGKNVMRSFV